MSLETQWADRALGSYLGLAVGDALGATVEFMTAREIAEIHGVHRDLVGGGWLRLRPGAVTDDTQMSIALGKAIIETEGVWSLKAVAEAYVDWLRHRPPDVGNTCRRGLRRYLQNGSLCAPEAEDDAGNGAAMRNLPVVLSTLLDDKAFVEHTLGQAHITHANRLSDAATLTLGHMTRTLVLGGTALEAEAHAHALVAAYPIFKYLPWQGRSSGYIVDTVQTVLEGFSQTTDFESCLLRVVNRGGDADTTGALAGQLAGAYYGASRIPPRWLKRLDPLVKQTIHYQTQVLLAISAAGAQRVDPESV